MSIKPNTFRTFFESFLLEGKVLDDALKSANNTIDKSSKTDEQKSQLKAVLTKEMPAMEPLFQKRKNVPNADWLGWIGGRIVQGDQLLPADKAQLVHSSDWMMSTNRMSNFSFRQFPNLRRLLTKLDEMENPNKGQEKKEEDSSELSSAMEVGMARRQQSVKSNKKTLAINMEGKEYNNIIDCGSGWYWQDINKAYCEDEAASMSHCGNVTGKQKPWQRIFSLRKKVGEHQFVPYLTFVFDPKTGVLGEKKGVDNTKPSKAFHPMIMKLLELPMIKSLSSSGSYAAAKDFKLKDLTDAQIEEVFAKNPQLKTSAKDRYSFQELLDATTGISKSAVRNARNALYDKLYQYGFPDWEYEQRREWSQTFGLEYSRHGDDVAGQFGYTNEESMANWAINSIAELKGDLRIDALNQETRPALVAKLNPEKEYPSGYGKELTDAVVIQFGQIEEAITGTIKKQAAYLVEMIAKFHAAFDQNETIFQETATGIMSLSDDDLVDFVSGDQDIEDFEFDSDDIAMGVDRAAKKWLAEVEVGIPTGGYDGSKHSKFDNARYVFQSDILGNLTYKKLVELTQMSGADLSYYCYNQDFLQAWFDNVQNLTREFDDAFTEVKNEADRQLKKWDEDIEQYLTSDEVYAEKSEENGWEFDSDGELISDDAEDEEDED